MPKEPRTSGRLRQRAQQEEKAVLPESVDRKKMERGVKLLLEGMACDLTDPNFKETPQRVARMYEDLLTIPKATIKEFPSNHAGLVLLRGHRLFGICPHHLLPFEMVAYLGYVPNKRVLGLSKLARLLEEHRTRPILQEKFTDDVAYDLFSRTDAKGSGCVVVGKHGCMQCRGVKTTGDVVTSSMHGVFLLNPTAREEFLRLIGRP